MDICQENETNSRNNDTQVPEEPQLTLTCPDERTERTHVCCLLNISDLTLAEDERASELAVGTGWEEAVHGWGRTSPTACIWSRKKVKKVRAGEGTSNCLFCISLSQGSVEARAPAENGKPEAGAVTDIGLEKTWASPSQGPSQATTSKEPNKLCFPTYAHGEKKSLQIKEFIWCLEDWAIPETANSKVPRNPSGSTDRGFSTSDSLASKALLVLPPLKGPPSNGLDVLGKKSKSVFWRPEEKVLKVDKDECGSCACGFKAADSKGEKKHLKVTDMLPATLTSVPTESQPCCLHWSLLAERSSGSPSSPSSPSNIHYLATLQLLQKQGIQSYRAKFKAKEQRPPRHTHKHITPAAKQDSRLLENKVLPRPLLPSLTVSRVVIPISTHRVL